MLNERFEHLIEYMYTLSTYDTNMTSTKRFYGLGYWRCQPIVQRAVVSICSR
jgi:hypothetical protein